MCYQWVMVMLKIFKYSFFVICSIVLFSSNVYAKTINDLYNELDRLEEEKEFINSMSSDDLDKIIASSKSLDMVIDSMSREIHNINLEIEEEYNKIDKINKEIDAMLVYFQISKGENIEVEYVLDSRSYSDLIYRYMVMRELTGYNNSLIDKLNASISALEDKKSLLEKREKQLDKNRGNYRDLEVLIKSATSGDDLSTSIDDDILLIKNEISYYENKGCSRYVNLNYCNNISNSDRLFYPLKYGCVSKDYIVGDVNHKGIDLACASEGESVYSAGDGVVSLVINETECGGNIVFISHNVNNKKYTTIYGHLLSINVKQGDRVSSNTVIGTVGGGSTAVINGGYDRCSTGVHLHFAITEGYHTYDFKGYTFDPRYIFSFPPVLNGYFSR